MVFTSGCPMSLIALLMCRAVLNCCHPATDRQIQCRDNYCNDIRLLQGSGANPNYNLRDDYDYEVDVGPLLQSEGKWTKWISEENTHDIGVYRHCWDDHVVTQV